MAEKEKELDQREKAIAEKEVDHETKWAKRDRIIWARGEKLKEREAELNEREKTLLERERAFRKRTREVLDQESEEEAQLHNKKIKQNRSANEVVNSS